MEIAMDEPTTEAQVHDIRVRNEGSLFTFTPLTDQGLAWIEENTPSEAFTGRFLVVEHRYARDIAAGMEQDGLRLV